jgi:BirA family biotin operon repressor/biotin-[acetyl-CoA-carboxylase] ligase
MPFKDNFNKNFMGLFKVFQHGKAWVLLEDDSISEYNLKEIQMLLLMARRRPQWA